jgi:hypothetical protein
MLQGGGRQGLVAEAGAQLGRHQDRGVRHLEGHVAAQGGVVSQVHDAEATAAQFPLQGEAAHLRQR